MSMPKDELQSEYVEAWRTYLKSLEQALNSLETQIQEVTEMAGTCTSEWCEATQHTIDDLSNALFSISEPRWSNPEDTAKIKALKRRIYNLYADYREAYTKASAA